MDREWIEDKKEQLKKATIFINENGNEAVEVSLTVFNTLIEQAERALELEDIKRKLSKDKSMFIEELVREQQQSKHYRKLLEKLACYVNPRLIKLNESYRELIDDVTKALEGEE